MKARVQNSSYTGRLALPHRFSIFLALAFLTSSPAPRLTAQSLGDGFDYGRGLAAVKLINTLLPGTTTNNMGGASSLADLLVQPEPPESPQFKFAHGNDGSDTGVPSLLYGTASAGGASGFGTVFSLKNDGTGYSVLHDFTGGSDGNGPASGLVISSNTLYGTTVNGGNYDNGVVFTVDTGGTNFAVLHHFTARYNYPYTNSDGGNPYCQLISSKNMLYGTASDGGNGNAGTVFAINLNNTNFTVLHTFTAVTEDANSNLTNSDGAYPYARLLLLDDTLYGTTSGGGAGGSGTVFALNLANTNFTVLHSFAEINYLTLTNTDGTAPYDGLILSGNMLYGTASRGGNANFGTVFAVNTNGAGFTNLYSFTGGSDGAFPHGELILFSNALIGTARSGGDNSLNNGGNGTVFGLNTNGTGFTVLHTFTAGNYDYDLQGTSYLTNSEGAEPAAGLTAVSNTLYGTASEGGGGANGTVFSLSFVPAPNILGVTLSGNNLRISGTDALPSETCVTLMSQNLARPLAQWNPVATNILEVTGDFTITATNAVDPSAPQSFFILQTH
jgi:uncharacterized repeat protein (TIGR03803 family)